MTSLEIIDTIVKIGLGALISGVTAYILANRSYKFELKKKNVEDRKEILLKIINKIRVAASLKNNCMHVLANKRTEFMNMESPSNFVFEELAMLAEAQNELGLSISYCYLLDLPKLAELIEEQFISYGQQRKYIGLKTLDYDINYLEECALKSRLIQSKMNAMYGTLLKSIYS